MIQEVIEYRETLTLPEIKGNIFVIDDFLHMDDAILLEQYLSSWDRKWQVVSKNVAGVYAYKDNPDVRDMYMKYDFFDQQTQVSEDIWMLDPFIKDRLNPIALTRIRANLYPAREDHFEMGWHADFPGMATAVYYVNTNNGGTRFKEGTVQSKRGRCVIFDSEIEHTTVTQTDTSTRILINFNYFPGKHSLKVKEGSYGQ